MDTKFRTIEIDSVNSFIKALDILHDGIVDESDIIYNTSEKTVDIFIEREYLEDKRAIKVERKFLFFEKITYPLMKTHLQLKNIKDFRKILRTKDASLWRHSFNEVKIRNEIFILKFSEDFIRIELSFDGEPIGFLRDIEFVKDCERTFYSFSFGPFIKRSIWTGFG